MPWCPQCKNEYVEGVKTCVECGIDLVDELPEEIDPEAPIVLCTTVTEEIGSKFVAFLQYGGIQTAGLLPSEEEEGKTDVVVAYFEKEAAEKMFEGFDSVEAMAEMDITELVPDIEKQLEELESEEAKVMLSDLRTEASSVYVKKKDKYTDLKFSGISFIVFGCLGFALLAVNMLGYISLFNKFSTLIMTIVFIIFFGIGISSLLRAKKLKGIVSEEEKVTNEVLDWVDANITPELMASLENSELSEEDNYFHVHEELCRQVSEQFPFFSKGYIDELMDDRYNEYCENK